MSALAIASSNLACASVRPLQGASGGRDAAWQERSFLVLAAGWLSSDLAVRTGRSWPHDHQVAVLGVRYPRNAASSVVGTPGSSQASVAPGLAGCTASTFTGLGRQGRLGLPRRCRMRLAAPRQGPKGSASFARPPSEVYQSRVSALLLRVQHSPLGTECTPIDTAGGNGE